MESRHYKEMFPLIVAVVIGAAAVASRALSKADDANDALDQTKEMLAQRDMELAKEKKAVRNITTRCAQLDKDVTSVKRKLDESEDARLTAESRHIKKSCLFDQSRVLNKSVNMYTADNMNKKDAELEKKDAELAKLNAELAKQNAKLQSLKEIMRVD